jgi:hypothetical protein
VADEAAVRLVETGATGGCGGAGRLMARGGVWFGG